MSREAVEEYRRKNRRHGSATLTELGSDGFYRPPAGDTCPLCEDIAWSCGTGAHLKTIQHVAAKYDLSIRELKSAIAAYVPEERGTTVYKALRVTADGHHVDSPTSSGYIWSNDVHEAYCESCDESPGDTCLCGFYVWWHIQDAAAYCHRSRDIIVKMDIGGLIEECTDGARAQYAAIQAVLDYPQDNDEPEWPARAAEILQVPLIDEEI